MAANLNDGLALVHKHLVETSTIAALIDGGTAVFLSSPRDPTPGEVRLPAVILSLEGGEGFGSSVQLVQAVVMIWAFSRSSQSEAGALHHAVLEALQRQHIRSTTTLSGGSLANAARVGCDFRGGLQDTWSEALGAWGRGSRWMLTIT